MALDDPLGCGPFDIGDGPLMPDRHIMETGHVSPEVYLSNERFAEERALFRSVWLLVGRTNDVPERNDWVVREIAVCSTSVLIVHGGDGEIRAFHNFCPHRGTKLVWGEAKGCSPQFICPYHAWSFGTDGALRHVPDRSAFPLLDEKTSGLAPIALEVWNGFIFVNLDAEPKQTLAEFLGETGELIGKIPFDEFDYCLRMTNLIDGNWKAGLEAASEGYHIQALHKNSVKEMVCSKANPYVRPLSTVFRGAHRQMAAPNNPEFRPSERRPVQKLVFECVPYMVVSESGQSDLMVPGMNHDNSKDWAVDLFALFPNTILHVALNGFYTFQYWPIEPGKYLWEARMYYRNAPRSRREEFGIHGTAAFNRDISTEDATCIESQQVAFASGAKPYIQFGESELLCRHQAALIEAYVNDRAARANSGSPK